MFFLGLPDPPDQWSVGRNPGLDESYYHLHQEMDCPRRGRGAG